MKSNISFEDFTKLEMRIARIIKVEEVEGADKLYKITLDVGELGERVVAGGFKPFYDPSEMKGKLVPYLANLEPRVIRGIESQGMIVAAGDKEAVLLTADKEIKPGEVVR